MRGTRVLSAVLAAAFVLGFSGCSKTKDINLDSAYFEDSKSIGNDYRNTTANLFNYYSRYGIARSGDVIYVKTFEVRTSISFTPFGFDESWYETIYRYEEGKCKKVYEGEQKTGIDMADSSLKIFEGKVLCSSTRVANNTITYLNEDTGRFEELFTVQTPDGSDLNHYEMMGDKLIITSVAENLYEYSGGELTQLPLEDTYKPGESFVYDYSETEFFYTDLYSSDNGRKLKDAKVYSYDIKNRKTSACYDFSLVDDGLKNLSIGSIYPADNYFYITLAGSEEAVGYVSALYRVSRKDMSAVKVADKLNDQDIIVNVRGDSAVFAFCDGLKKGLYLTSPESDTLKELYPDEVGSINFIDDKWIFFTDSENILYRIPPEGGEPIKVMDTN